MYHHMIDGRSAMAVSSIQRTMAILALSILSISFLCLILDDITSSASDEVSRQLLQNDVDDLDDTRHIDGHQYMQLPWIRKTQEVPLSGASTESAEDELIQVDNIQLQVQQQLLRQASKQKQSYEDFTAKGFVMQIENFGRFSNLIIELLHLALMARALDRIAITSMGLEYLPSFDLNGLNMIASGRTCTSGETNPEFCCRVKGWHYDEDPVVIKFIEGRDQTVPELLKDRKNWSTGCRILFREHRAESTDGFRITQLLSNKHYMDRDCGTIDEPTCITADLLGPLHSPPTSQQIPVLSVEGSILFSLNVAEDIGSNSALQKYLNLLQSVSPPTLSFSSAVKTAGSALYQHSLQAAAVPEDSPSTVAIHMRLGDGQSPSLWKTAPSPSLWKTWVDMTHPNSKVAFIGTNANQWQMEEIKGLFPDALIGCPHDLFPQCTGPMMFAIEQMSMSLHTYFGGFEPSTYSSNIASHRLLLGHSIYSVMAFGEQPGTLGDLKPFKRMDSGFGIHYCSKSCRPQNQCSCELSSGALTAL